MAVFDVFGSIHKVGYHFHRNPWLVFFLTIIVGILPANNAFGCRYQATVPVGPVYSYDGNASKAIIAVLSPGEIPSSEKLIFIGLLLGKHSSFSIV